MLFSRSKGREVEPPRHTLFKGFGNLYNTFFTGPLNKYGNTFFTGPLNKYGNTVTDGSSRIYEKQHTSVA